MNKLIKPKHWLSRFLTGPNFLMQKPARDYLAVNTAEHQVVNDWHQHHVIQFESVKEWESWASDNLSKNERRFWVLYKRLKTHTGDAQR